MKFELESTMVVYKFLDRRFRVTYYKGKITEVCEIKESASFFMGLNSRDVPKFSPNFLIAEYFIRTFVKCIEHYANGINFFMSKYPNEWSFRINTEKFEKVFTKLTETGDFKLFAYELEQKALNPEEKRK